MPVPVGEVPPAVAEYLGELEGRIAELENPNGPSVLPKMLAAQLTAANAVVNAYRFVLVTDLNMTAHSNGAHWYRSDTGALII